MRKKWKTRQASSMIHSPIPKVSPVANIVFAWNLFCFEKWGRTNVRTYRRHLRKQWSLPAVNVGRPRGLKRKLQKDAGDIWLLHIFFLQLSRSKKKTFFITWTEKNSWQGIKENIAVSFSYSNYTTTYAVSDPLHIHKSYDKKLHNNLASKLV